MAVALRATSTGSTGASTAAVNFTIASPAGLAAGDLCVLAVEMQGAGRTASASGFTPFPAASGNGQSLQILWRWITGSETWPLTVSLSAATEAAGCMYAASGATFFDPFPATSGQTNISSATLSVAGITTHADADLLVWFGCCTGGSGLTVPTISVPAGMTARSTQINTSTAATTNVGVVCADTVQAVHGATGNQNGSLSAARTSAGFLVSLSGADIPIGTLSDNFNDNSVNAGIWWTTANVAETHQRTEITSTLAPAYFQEGSQLIYDVTGGSVFCQFGAGDQTIPSWEVYPLYLINQNYPPENSFFFVVSQNGISAHKKVGGTNTTVASAAYDPVNHAWVRISESAGTATYWTSPDGVTWTSFGTTASNSFPITALGLLLQAGTYATEVSTTTAWIDNVNISLRNQAGRSRLAVVSTSAQAGRARLFGASQTTEVGRARISISGLTRTQAGISRLRIGNAQSLQPGRANIIVAGVRQSLQAGTARLSAQRQAALPGRSRIAALVPTSTQAGTSRVLLQRSSTVAGRSRIGTGLHSLGQPGRSRLRSVVARAQTGRANIFSPFRKTSILAGRTRLSLPIAGSSTQAGRSRLVGLPRPPTARPACGASVQLCALRVSALDANGAAIGKAMVVDAVGRMEVSPVYAQAADIDIVPPSGLGGIYQPMRAVFKRYDCSLQLLWVDPELEALLIGRPTLSSSTGAAAYGSGPYGAGAYGAGGGAVVVGAAEVDVGQLGAPAGVSLEFWTRHVTSGDLDPVFPFVHWIMPRSYWQADKATWDGSVMLHQYTGFTDENHGWTAGPGQDWVFDSAHSLAYCLTAAMPAPRCGT